MLSGQCKEILNKDITLKELDQMTSKNVDKKNKMCENVMVSKFSV